MVQSGNRRILALDGFVDIKDVATRNILGKVPGNHLKLLKIWQENLLFISYKIAQEIFILLGYI